MREHDLRIRLEGGAELLEATRLRYRALTQALRGWTWRDKLRRNVEVLREVVRVQAQVDEVLSSASKKAVAEHWEPGPLLTCLDEVRALHTELRQRVSLRLERGATLSLAEDLAALEAQVSLEPRLVLPARRWAVACEVLPRSSPTVEAVAQFGAALEQHFSRPMDDSGPIPVSPAEMRAVADTWPTGTSALDEAWQRVAAIDLTGGVRRALVRRSKRAPGSPLEPVGPAVLVHAEFWRTFALGRMTRIVSSRVEPVVVTRDEVLPVFEWLVQRQVEPVRLVHPVVAPARAALLELSLVVRGAGGAVPRSSDVFGLLRSLADQADLARDAADWRRVRDALLLVLRVTLTPPGGHLPPVYRVGQPKPPRPEPIDPSRLGALVRRLEAQLERRSG